jgi:hypothetical protein
MPGAIYHSDGSGRDSYVNFGARIATQQGVVQKNSFWPKELTPSRERRHGLGEAMGMASLPTLGSSLASNGSNPRTARGSVKPFNLADVLSAEGAPGQYVSARRCLSPASHSPQSPNGLRGVSASRAAFPSPLSARPAESEAASAGRTGRFRSPNRAPAFTGALPGIHARLHQTVGVLGEF